jgi:hypothetical protein
MNNVTQYLSRLALTFWLGEMLFFIAIFAPRVFKILPRVDAGRLQAAIFPPYYTAGLIAAAVLFVAFLFRFWNGDPTLPARKEFLLAIPALTLLAAAIFAHSRWAITPELNGLREAVYAGDAAAQTRFTELHQLSVRLNGGALLMLLGLLGLI